MNPLSTTGSFVCYVSALEEAKETLGHYRSLNLPAREHILKNKIKIGTRPVLITLTLGEYR